MRSDVVQGLVVNNEGFGPLLTIRRHILRLEGEIGSQGGIKIVNNEVVYDRSCSVEIINAAVSAALASYVRKNTNFFGSLFKIRKNINIIKINIEFQNSMKTMCDEYDSKCREIKSFLGKRDFDVDTVQEIFSKWHYNFCCKRDELIEAYCMKRFGGN